MPTLTYLHSQYSPQQPGTDSLKFLVPFQMPAASWAILL